mgnify:CR=1 FL=1
MISKLLPFMRCPVCSHAVVVESSEGLMCDRCHAFFPLKSGIVDMLPNEAEEVITPFQRLMQTPAIVSVYEGMWRRIGYYLASSRSFASELETVLRNTQTILGIEALCATQAIDLLAPLEPGEGTRRGYQIVRRLAPRLRGDRYLAPEIERVRQAVTRGEFAAVVRALRAAG